MKRSVKTGEIVEIPPKPTKKKTAEDESNQKAKGSAENEKNERVDGENKEQAKSGTKPDDRSEDGKQVDGSGDKSKENEQEIQE